MAVHQDLITRATLHHPRAWPSPPTHVPQKGPRRKWRGVQPETSSPSPPALTDLRIDLSWLQDLVFAQASRRFGSSWVYKPHSPRVRVLISGKDSGDKVGTNDVRRENNGFKTHVYIALKIALSLGWQNTCPHLQNEPRWQQMYFILINLPVLKAQDGEL